MKKKLKLQDLQIKSFVTEVPKKGVLGGQSVPETMYSCMAYITCDIIRCYIEPGA